MFFGQKDAQQVAVLRRMISDLHLELALEVVPTSATPTGSRFVAQRPPLRRGARESTRVAPGVARVTQTARAILDTGGLEIDGSTSNRPAHARRWSPRRHHPLDRQPSLEEDT